MRLVYIGGTGGMFGPLHSASGNRMRYTLGRIEVVLDDAWRTAMPPWQRRLVGLLSGPVARRYGYAWSEG